MPVIVNAKRPALCGPFFFEVLCARAKLALIAARRL
jgi:hypothetical protein